MASSWLTACHYTRPPLTLRNHDSRQHLYQYPPALFQSFFGNTQAVIEYAGSVGTVWTINFGAGQSTTFSSSSMSPEPRPS